MSDFLSTMADLSLVRVADLREGVGSAGLASRAASAPPPVPLTLDPSGFDVIAEAKLSSPSAGELTTGGAEVVVGLARSYEANGAAAISVLTEETRFAGSIEHLAAAAAAVAIPVMRKDFLVDPIQLLEARAAGASGVLLIARLLPEQLLVEMTEQTLDLGMFALIEVFDRSDIETAMPVFNHDVLVGVNSRDLVSLEVDPGRFSSLAPLLPDHLPAVAESGIDTPEDIAGAARLSYRLALVGTSLVTAPDPGASLAQLLAAGRAALAEQR